MPSNYAEDICEAAHKIFKGADQETFRRLRATIADGNGLSAAIEASAGQLEERAKDCVIRWILKQLKTGQSDGPRAAPKAAFEVICDD